MIDRRKVIGSIGAAAMAWPIAVHAQAPRRMVRIGIVSVGGPSAEMTGPLPSNPNVRAFLRGMAELGYVFGRDFVTEPRGTDAVASIGELVDLKVDMIVATGRRDAIRAQAGDEHDSHRHDGRSGSGKTRICRESRPARRQLYGHELAEPGAHGQATANTERARSRCAGRSGFLGLDRPGTTGRR